MNATVCTLFEGHYHIGAGALINSLHAAGFAGRIVCGYRGAPPPWAEAAANLSGQIAVQFVPVTADTHLTYYKPTFLRACLERHAPDTEQLYYLDPDIVVKAPWSVFARWARDGLALCEDVNGYLPARHPYRLLWRDFFVRRQQQPVRELDRYYNAGFIGLPRAAEPFLALWERFSELAGEELESRGTLKHAAPHALFHSADQDAMNMALLCTDVPINGAGPEAMDFAVGGHLLAHAVGSPKPWRAPFVRDSLRGRPPHPAARHFYRFARRPLALFDAPTLAWRGLSLKLAAAIGRVYRRT